MSSPETLPTGAKVLNSGPAGRKTRGSAKLGSSGSVKYAHRNFTTPGGGQARSFARPGRAGAACELLSLDDADGAVEQIRELSENTPAHTSRMSGGFSIPQWFMQVRLDDLG